MSRTRYPMPQALRTICFNLRVGAYEIQEDEVLYQMNLEEARSMRGYFRTYRAS